jgi:hypothetical protein
MTDPYKILKVLGTTSSEHRSWLSYEVDGTSELSLGWILNKRPIDAGPPPQVVDLLARCLDSFGSIIYGRPVGEGSPAPQLAVLSGFEFNGLFGMFGPQIEFVWSDNAAGIKEMFQTGYLIWEQESQFALMYKSKVAPTVQRKALMSAFKNGDFGNANLKSSGATGAMLPGADGDFAHFVFYEEANRNVFIELLTKTCSESGLTLEMVDGQTFEDANWYAFDPENQDAAKP